MTDDAITAFRGQWTKLGNYSSCTVFYEGHAYPSVEHAYQAQKTTDKALQKAVREQATPALAKKLARTLPLRPDWDAVKRGIMLDLLREKFAQELVRAELRTGTLAAPSETWMPASAVDAR